MEFTHRKDTIGANKAERNRWRCQGLPLMSSSSSSSTAKRLRRRVRIVLASISQWNFLSIFTRWLRLSDEARINVCIIHGSKKHKTGWTRGSKCRRPWNIRRSLCFSAPALRSRFVEKFSLCLLLASRKTEYNISTMPDKQTVNVRFAPLFVAPCRYGDISLTFLKSLRFSVGFCAHTSWECDAV